MMSQAMTVDEALKRLNKTNESVGVALAVEIGRQKSEIAALKAKLAAQEDELRLLRAVAEAGDRWNNAKPQGLGQCGNSDDNILRRAVVAWREWKKREWR